MYYASKMIRVLFVTEVIIAKEIIQIVFLNCASADLVTSILYEVAVGNIRRCHFRILLKP